MTRAKNLRIAVVCSSNQNRSMEAHSFLSKRGFNVKSYGTGSHVKLPGSSADRPNVYSFDTPYDQMYRELAQKDPQLFKRRFYYTKQVADAYETFTPNSQDNMIPLKLSIESGLETLPYGMSLTAERKSVSSDSKIYKQNGILHMLDRNRRIKLCPQRFQDEYEEMFDIVITAEERVYDQVIEEFNRREPDSYCPVHVINIDVQDNHEEATLGAFQICDLCERLERLEDLDDDISRSLDLFEKKLKRRVLHTVAFY